MLQLSCPWCGVRDETEFRYRGDATLLRPPPDAPVAAFEAYVYARVNPYGWHREWWLHTGGCRMLFQVERHTMTHELRNVVASESNPTTANTAGR
jgi:heterotetrameric sarcosine oxidase delta subunit